ncbi:ATP-binding protein [Marinoscillum sp.]|uniref:ATP-binding protein n=1 Tax=Marinoscillum sp. TaxID=2024838 RepID=UPI003BA99A5C
MQKYFLFLLAVLCHGQVLFGQVYDLDSLKSLDLQRMEVADQLETYNQIIRMSINDEDSTIKYATLMMELAKEQHLNDYAKALTYLGQTHLDQGEYQVALQYMLEALEISDHLPESNQAFIYSIIGKLYGRIEEVQNMSKYYLQSAQMYFVIGDSTGVAINYNNLADGLYKFGRYDSALHYYSLAKALCEPLGYDVFYKMIEGSEGIVYATLGQDELAESRLLSAIEAVKGTAQTIPYITYKQELADLYLKQGRLPEAETHLIECYQLSEENGLKEQLRDASESMSLLYEEKGNFQSSLNYYKRYQTFKDSIENLETVKTMANMRKEYEVGQKQAEVDLLTAEKRNQRLVLLGVSLFALVFVVLAFIIYRFYQSKARINAELERLNQTKDKFFSIISHDLRGPVSSFMGISRMIKYMVQAKQTDQLLEIADDIDESVDRLSALLDNLLNWAMQQQGHFPNVPEKVNLEELSEDLVRTLHTMAKGKQINLYHEMSATIHLWVDRNTTMTILRNLVNNALKFTPEGGKVLISAKESRGMAEIRVSDTGVGIPQEKLDKLFQLEDKKSTYGTLGEKGLGLGLQLVYEFIELNSGEIDVESEEGKGTTFVVRLPLYELSEENIPTEP